MLDAGNTAVNEVVVFPALMLFLFLQGRQTININTNKWAHLLGLEVGKLMWQKCWGRSAIFKRVIRKVLAEEVPFSWSLRGLKTSVAQRAWETTFQVESTVGVSTCWSNWEYGVKVWIECLCKMGLGHREEPGRSILYMHWEAIEKFGEGSRVISFTLLKSSLTQHVALGGEQGQAEPVPRDSCGRVTKPETLEMRTQQDSHP